MKSNIIPAAPRLLAGGVLGVGFAAMVLGSTVASADIVLVDESFGDRDLPFSPVPMGNNISFNTYNNAGPQSAGGATLAVDGQIDPDLPVSPVLGPGLASSGSNSLRVFAVDDNVFTGNRQTTEMFIGITGAGESPLAEATFDQRQFTQFDDPGGGLGSFDLAFDYRVTGVSFVPGFDGGGSATLPASLPLNEFAFRVFDPDNNDIVPGDQPANVTMASIPGLNQTPIELLADDQWHTEERNALVLSAGTRASLIGAEADGVLENTLTVVQITIDDTSDGEAGVRIAYELFIDNIRILTDGALVGDYNGDGFVSQGDLDLVLLNWGDTVVPAGFDESALDGGGPFDGLVSQNELDGVLLNWGDGTPPGATAIPEPASLALLSLAGLSTAGRRRRDRG